MYNFLSLKHLIVMLLLFFPSSSSASWENIKSSVLIEIKEASGYLPAIVRSNVNIRSKPSKSASKLGLLHGGTAIRAEFLTNSDWAKVLVNGEDAYIHKSALIKHVYKADIKYHQDDSNSTVFSMSGWHYSQLPGSYFLTYHSNLFGHATFGPIRGDGYGSIKSHLYKLDYDKRDIYLATGHGSGTRSYYTPYLAIPKKSDLLVFVLPYFTSNESNKLSIKGDTLIYEGKSFYNCCEFEQFSLKFDLKNLSYSGETFHYKNRGSETDSALVKEIKVLNLTSKILPLVKSY
jgi:hypothetical protein